MNQRCLIIGIDGYAFKPLSSAVNDALAIRKKLISTRLFAAEEIDLLLSPKKGARIDIPTGTNPATADNIRDYVYALYDARKPLDRFMLYYSGHGLSAWNDKTHSKLSTAIIPADVRSIEQDGNKLVDFDDLRARFRMRGPLEQFYILDACRDLGFDNNPDVASLGFTAKKDEAPRRQGTLFAVSPRGQARGFADGLGVMTRHVLDALDGTGKALDRIVVGNRQRYAVTIRSLFDYVHGRVEKDLSGVEAWSLYFNLPTFDESEQKTTYLRLIDQPPQPDLTVNVDPPEAATAVTAALKLFSYQAGSWPPFGVPVKAEPTQYELFATLTGDSRRWMAPDPDVRVVDVREEQVVILKVAPRGAPAESPTGAEPPQPLVVTTAAPEVSADAPQPALESLNIKIPKIGIGLNSKRIDLVEATQELLNSVEKVDLKVDGLFGPVTKRAVADFQSRRGLRSDGKVTPRTWTELRSVVRDAHQGVIEVRADAGIMATIESQAGARDIYHAVPGQELTLPAGSYRVTFLFGDSVLNRADLLLHPGQHRVVTAAAETGPALAELIAQADPLTPHKTHHTPSESIGPMQVAVLPTLLPLIGLKAFDPNRHVLTRIPLDVPPIGGNPDGHVALTIAFEGAWAPARIDEMLAGVRMSSVAAKEPDDGGKAPSNNALTGTAALHPVRDRIGLLLAKPGLGASRVVVTVPRLATIDIATCAIPRRVTCLGLVITPDGRVTLAQSLLLPPDVPSEDPTAQDITPQRAARLLAMVDGIYGGIGEVGSPSRKELDNLEYGKWIDPLFGVFAWLVRSGHVVPRTGSKKDKAISDIVFGNLKKYFPALPDVLIIEAIRDKRSWSAVLADAPEPLFAATLRAAAAGALARGQPDHAYVARSAKIDPGATWNMIVNPPTSAQM
jgi:Caspase domain/Putative peptidoglycan binding domain